MFRSIFGGGGGDAQTLQGSSLAEVLTAAFAAADGNVDASTLETLNLAAVLAAAVSAAGTALDGTVDAGTLGGSNLAAVIAAAQTGVNATQLQGSSLSAVLASALAAATAADLPVLIDTVQGRLSADSSDPTAQGTSSTLYYLPFVGNQIALPDGSGGWVLRSIGSGLSFALSGNDLQGNPIASNAAYEVCVWDNGGTATLALRRWTSTTSRGAGATLSSQDGVPVLDSNGLMRSVGSICTNGSGNCQSTVGKRRISNRYNRREYRDHVPTTRSNYTMNGTIGDRTLNASAYDEFQHVFMSCLAEDVVAHLNILVGFGSGTYTAWVALDGSQAGPKFQLGATGTVRTFGVAREQTGLHTLASYESTVSATSIIANLAPAGAYAGFVASGEW